MSNWIRKNASSLAGAMCLCAVVPAIDLGEHVQWIEMAFVIVFLILSLGIHEAAHAWVANKCGDSTGKDLGRITLNPIAHIDPIMSIVVPGVMFAMSGGSMVFGGAKPVPVDYSRLRHPLRDMSLVAIAGPLSNFLLAIVFLLAWKASRSLGHYPPNNLLPQVLKTSMYTNLLLAAFNMLPIPPLDGSRVMTWLLPAPLRRSYVAFEGIGMLLVIVAWFWVPGVQRAVMSGVEAMTTFIDVITGGAW